MFSLDFDSLSLTADLKSFSHFVIDTIINFVSYNSGVIVMVISNHLPDYSLNCIPLSPITITNHLNNSNSNNLFI